MDAIEFYELTKSTLECMAQKRNISTTELAKYYKLTDKYMVFYNDPDLNEIQKVFAQMAFHAQNATMISNIVKFKENYDFLKRITKNFSPKEFLTKFEKFTEDEEKIDAIVEELKDTLKWESSKTKNENKSIVRRYAHTLFDCANYLKEFNGHRQVLKDLKNKNNNDVIKCFRKKIKHGFSVALTCDFLKEFDEEFNYLPKPDIHIMDVMRTINNKQAKYSTDKSKMELIKEIQDLTEEINKGLKNEDEITVYQLDRMIWLVCTDSFFLHSNNGSKKYYLDKIQQL